MSLRGCGFYVLTGGMVHILFRLEVNPMAKIIINVLLVILIIAVVVLAVLYFLGTNSRSARWNSSSFRCGGPDRIHPGD